MAEWDVEIEMMHKKGDAGYAVASGGGGKQACRLSAARHSLSDSEAAFDELKPHG